MVASDLMPRLRAKAASWLMALAVMAALGTARAAEAPTAPPFGLAWGTSIDQQAIAGEAEPNGNTMGASLAVTTRNPEIYNVMGIFCAEAGLQEVRTITYFYTRDRILKEFNIWYAALADRFGPHQAGAPANATAYWPNGVSLEAYPATKTKFYLRIDYRGPERDRACKPES